MALKQIAKDTLDLIEAGTYEVGDRTVSFADAQQRALSQTRVYCPDEFDSIEATAGDGAPTIRVVDGTTQVVAQSMANDGHVALLNFASARNPGGGFLNGAKAQEEDLCRCSGLYPCLAACSQYYDANRNQTSLLYTDHAIFSPMVPFFKTRGTGDLLAEPFVASVITAPAPNSGPFLRLGPNATAELENTFARRWRNVLRIARDQNVTRLLLGAWGCGAFGGDPAMAARTAKAAIETDGDGIDEIVFAIPGKGRQSKANLDAFCEVFA
ncbi:TIGR02452 family protein [Allorhodopirellula heiligendammensis]|uniref:Microbial-type PARG catalytic domain-containing protein n=1 Tax=Allorhodopirellula heiligendammensis TaxID=2714739 RepID=A0A5C6BZT0_9BACT|nr:TIGR02452 family protein [Allorhodopirellula heiligendammensis]TWU17880.1 hypothetical protein Poly21_00310 [Allorhodopirellula heiligendammensis]